MDYQSELKKLQEGSDYWKPKVGQFKVKALTELEPAEPYVKKRDDGTEESHEQYKIKILVNGEEKIWTFGKGKTPASTYGQLVQLATNHGNKLTDVEFSVVVKSDGTKNDYTIVN
jgi:DNA-binding protein H-NS